MSTKHIVGISVAAAGLMSSLGAAQLPPAMSGAGLWEVARKASGHSSQRLCLTDPAILTQWEHRRAQCRRSVVSAGENRTEISYACGGGEFGTSKVQALTPRALRIETQGISRGYPFGYVLHARRLGDCPGR
jgi:hypothetical protein